MAVRNTEKRLPFKTPADPKSGQMDPNELGQSVRAGPYVLISYLTSPIERGSRNDYVVFALDPAAADAYRWSVTDSESGAVVTSADTDTGVWNWVPDHSGEFDFVVEIQAAGAPTTKLRLRQTVLEPNPDKNLFEAFVTELDAAANEQGLTVPVYKAAVVLGEIATTREVLFDLWGYIFEGALATGDHGIPVRVLAAVLYNEILSRPKELTALTPHAVVPWYNRTAKIEAAAAELNNPTAFSLIPQIDFSLGVGEVKSETAAMLLGLTTWREKPKDPKARKKLDDQIKEDFRALSLEQKVDLFNLLRFPRSNIAVAGKLLARLKNRLHRWPELKQREVLGNADAVQILATEYNMGAVDTPRADAKPNPNGPKILKLTHALFLAPYFREHIDVDPPYGGFTLGMDDHDPDTYEGQQRSGLGDAHYVADLQNDLRDLGFRLAVGDKPQGVGDGKFAAMSRLAVREFQIFAKMNFIARELATAQPNTPFTDRLRGYINLYRYAGPISGVLNVETRRRLRAWKANGWRCPVVISVGSTDAQGNRTGLNANQQDNIWLFDTVPQSKGDKAAAMFAQDYTQYYRVEDLNAPNGYIKLGQHVPWDYGGNAYGGPVSEAPRHTWPNAEVLPTNLVGNDLARPPVGPPDAALADQESTFKVIRAISEVECMGFFDSLTAWDDAFISAGVVHWTLKGELGAYLSYLRKKDEVAYRRAVKFFGIDVERDWGADGSALLMPGEAKYQSGIAIQTEDGSFERLNLGSATDARSNGNAFKSWHWFYRLQMAARTIEGFQRRMWAMARMRIRDVRAADWPVAGGPKYRDKASNTTRLAKIGEVFTSERGIALVVRLHVKSPKNVTQATTASPNLASAFQRAIAHAPNLGTRQVNDWGDAEELALIQGFMEDAADPAGGYAHLLGHVHDWPLWERGKNSRGYQLQPGKLDPWSDAQGRRLSAARGSFLFWDLQPDEL